MVPCELPSGVYHLNCPCTFFPFIGIIRLRELVCIWVDGDQVKNCVAGASPRAGGSGVLGARQTQAHLFTASEPHADHSRCPRSCQAGWRHDAGPLPELGKDTRLEATQSPWS